jgi:hypothetical protein
LLMHCYPRRNILCHRQKTGKYARLFAGATPQRPVRAEANFGARPTKALLYHINSRINSSDSSSGCRVGRSDCLSPQRSQSKSTSAR